MIKIELTRNEAFYLKDILENVFNSRIHDDVYQEVAEDISQKIEGVFWDKIDCQHESDGNIYTSWPAQFKCIKCGEFY